VGDATTIFSVNAKRNRLRRAGESSRNFFGRVEWWKVRFTRWLAVQFNIQKKLAQLPFLSHYVNNKNSAAFAPVEDATWLYVQLAVNRIG
jgi:hypothetical protein